ncbi:MAG: hypothetical protein HGB12_04885 [Bacteroidetes bacterium]|nr:hypothetical protein [Bacteroidota bacterium]
MERITFEIESRKELNLLISIAEKLGIKRFFYSEAVKSKSAELQKIHHVIDKGVDISTFGDIKEWQRTTRSDRNLNFNGI